MRMENRKIILMMPIVGFTREESGMAVLLSATGDGKKDNECWYCI